MSSQISRSNAALSLRDVTVAVVTALPHEYFAAYTVLECSEDIAGEGRAPVTYRLGVVPSVTGGQHVVGVTMLAGAGTHSAATLVGAMTTDCPRLGLVIMCGIACAVPNPSRPEDHVRLGDIVVCGRGGIAHHQFIKEREGSVEVRSPPRPPSETTLEAIGRLEAAAMGGDRPWEGLVDQFAERLGKDWCRPDETEDILQETKGAQPIAHPEDINRRTGAPRLFKGVIASGNVLVAKAAVRDQVRESYNARAIEMEGSGVADAAHRYNIEYQVVRGTCDYGNQLKSDRWHNYAALIAACFTKSLIAQLPLSVAAREVPSSQLAEDAYAKGSSTVGSVDGGHPRSEHLVRTGERLVGEITTSLGALDHAQAFEAADELRALIDTGRSRLTSTTIASWLETLVRVEVLRAQLAAGEGHALDLSKARDYLQEAKDELERE